MHLVTTIAMTSTLQWHQNKQGAFAAKLAWAKETAKEYVLKKQRNIFLAEQQQDPELMTTRSRVDFDSKGG